MKNLKAEYFNYLLAVICIVALLLMQYNNNVTVQNLSNQTVSKQVTIDQLRDELNDCKCNLKEAMEALKYYELQSKIKEDIGGYHVPVETLKYINATKGQHELSLILGLMKTESNFKRKARSKVAFGYMQVNYLAWKKYLNIDYDRIYDSEYNIKLGIAILDYYHDISNGNLEKTLFLYNNGESGNYNNHKYAPKVLLAKHKIDNILNEVGPL